MSHAEKYLASILNSPKNSQDSMAIAVEVLPDTIDCLRATGVMPFTIALVLALEIKKIAQEQEWTDELRRQFVPPAFWHLLDDTPACVKPAAY